MTTLSEAAVQAMAKEQKRQDRIEHIAKVLYESSLRIDPRTTTNYYDLDTDEQLRWWLQAKSWLAAYDAIKVYDINEMVKRLSNEPED